MAAPTVRIGRLALIDLEANRAGSPFADRGPEFVDVHRHDFRLKPDSPALAIGFKPFDFTKAGVYGDPSWIKEARSPCHQRSSPQPPPLAISRGRFTSVMPKGVEHISR